MELDAVDWELLVHQPHDGAIFCFRRDFQAVGKGFPFHDQGVVAGRGQRAG